MGSTELDDSRLTALVDELEIVLAAEPGMLGRLETRHVGARGTGDCEGCRQYQRPSHRWPCNIIRAVWAIRQRRRGAETDSPGAQDESSTPLRVVE